MKLVYLKNDGKYNGEKRIFWSWKYFHLKPQRYYYLCTPIGAFKLSY